MSRGSMEMFQSTQKQLVERLPSEPALQQRTERMMSIRAVAPISRACFRFLDPLSLPEFSMFDLSATHRPVLAFRGLCTGISVPNTPYRLFQGRPIYYN